MASTKKNGALFFSVAALLFLSALFLAQCDSSNGGSSSDEVAIILTQFDGIRIGTLDLERMVAIGEAALSELSRFTNHESAEIRWGAVMSLGAIGRQLDTGEKTGPMIAKCMDDPDIWVRVTAAELCASSGFKEGLSALIDAVDSDLKLRLSEPPSPIATQAIMALKLYTGQDFIEEAHWRDWWDQNQDSLEWNPDNERFE
jgi:hypothetical protein